MMLLMLLIGIICRWSPKDIFWWNWIVSSKGGRSHFRITPLVRWRCNGSTLVRKKPPGNCKVICEMHIQFYFRGTLRTSNKQHRGRCYNLSECLCHMPQFCKKNNFILFEEHYVKFYAKLWLMTQWGQEYLM